MKKLIYIATGLSAMLVLAYSGLALSQNETEFGQDIDNDIKQEIEYEIDNVNIQPSVNLRPSRIRSKNLDQSNDYEVGESLPDGYVEDTPLKSSRADRFRKKRIETEQNTENTLVERLERERLRSERDRQKNLLKRLEAKKRAIEDNDEDQQEAEYQYPLANTKSRAAYVQPIPVVEQSYVEESYRDSSDDEMRFYVGGRAGVADYPSADNVRGVYALGASAGLEIDKQLMVEMGFTLSSYDVQTPYPLGYFPGVNPFFTPYLRQMDQWNISGEGKYRILRSKVSPVLGAAISYTRRAYKDINPVIMPQITSQAYDFGLLAGADLSLGNSFAVGLDFRYFFNLTNRVDQPVSYQIVTPVDQNSIESLSYYIFSLNSRFSF
ncbi:MAG: hypothetical protein COT74_13590 [Bdellovibrionales bacterium CG10_big_fil_rev_8_21_14_0_10_45_34]|nr:MAG: hypothetical protein COT74_13590 [Bdellovibrionales bacterium CG10_big_fil_rev_8_21_14_0_10_45_34]